MFSLYSIFILTCSCWRFYHLTRPFGPMVRLIGSNRNRSVSMKIDIGNNSLRHRIHACTYGTVAFGLFAMGCVFSGFAIFERQSQISKIWLAGPTTIAVALVLCGKVMIDRRPSSMNEGETQAIVKESSAKWTPACVELNLQPQRNGPGLSFTHEDPNRNILPFSSPSLAVLHQQPPLRIESHIWKLRQQDDHPPPYENHSGSLLAHHPYVYSEPAGTMQFGENGRIGRWNGADAETPSCCNTTYVNITDTRKSSNAPIYQGETFLLNDKPYLI